ncbi:LuxR C-terminal-related transcriptional regulator [Massilia sp. 9I]
MCSESTTKMYRARVLEKIGMTSRAELTRYALEPGFPG